MPIIGVCDGTVRLFVENLIINQYRMHCIIHDTYSPSEQKVGSGTVSSLFFLISLVAPNGEIDPQASRIIISGIVMSKIICNAGTAQKSKSKFVYDNTIHCLTSIRHTSLNTSYPDLVTTHNCLMLPNSSDSPQATSFPFLSRMIHNSQLAAGIAASGPEQLMWANNQPCHNGALSLAIRNLNDTGADGIDHGMANKRVPGMDGEVGTL